jgi:hypothetical protein
MPKVAFSCKLMKDKYANNIAEILRCSTALRELEVKPFSSELQWRAESIELISNAIKNNNTLSFLNLAGTRLTINFAGNNLGQHVRFLAGSCFELVALDLSGLACSLELIHRNSNK